MAISFLNKDKFHLVKKSCKRIGQAQVIQHTERGEPRGSTKNAKLMGFAIKCSWNIGNKKNKNMPKESLGRYCKWIVLSVALKKTL